MVFFNIALHCTILHSLHAKNYRQIEQLKHEKKVEKGEHEYSGDPRTFWNIYVAVGSHLGKKKIFMNGHYFPISTGANTRETRKIMLTRKILKRWPIVPIVSTLRIGTFFRSDWMLSMRG